MLGRLRVGVERHSNLIAAVLTLLSAVLGLLLVVVGSRGQAAREDASGLQERVGALESQVATRDGTIEALQDELDSKNAEIQKLRQLVPADVATPGDEDPLVYHQGEVAVSAAGDYIDLGAPPEDDRWLQGNGSELLGYFGSGQYDLEGVEAARMSTDAPTFEECRAPRTAYGLTKVTDLRVA